jgi:hypothetical protein
MTFFGILINAISSPMAWHVIWQLIKVMHTGPYTVNNYQQSNYFQNPVNKNSTTKPVKKFLYPFHRLFITILSI